MNIILIKFKNFLKFFCLGLLLFSLNACGGGGGGGIVSSVSNFIKNDFSDLAGSESIVNSYSSLLANFNSTISNGEYSSLSAVITGPNAEDISKANSLLEILDQAETLWSQTESLINSQSDNDKYLIYNSNSYKEAYTAYLYLKNSVKPIIQKVATGRTITLEDYNKIAKEEKAQEIIDNEKATSANSYVETKSIKTTQTLSTTSDTTTETKGSPVIVYSNWQTVHKGGGDERRTKTTTVKNFITTITTKCSFDRTTLLNGNTKDSEKNCVEINKVTVEIDPTITNETETRAGDNPVKLTENLDPIIEKKVEETSNYTETTYTDAIDTTSEITEGMATTKTTNRDVTTKTYNSDNTTTVTVTRFVDTTVTTPITTKTYKTRHYTDTIKKKVRDVIITTLLKKLTYKDGTIEEVKGSSSKVESDWKIIKVNVSQRSENILQNKSSSEKIITTSDNGTILSSQIVSNTYTDADQNLGTKTQNMSSVVSDHETMEYKSNYGLGEINASDAYARGWTGKGAVLGIIDTWQDTDHEKLNGKYLYYKDYDPYKGVVKQGQTHGTHVASIIAGARDGDELNDNGTLATGDYDQQRKWLNGNPYTHYELKKNNDMHGVAFDAKLVGANVDRFSRGWVAKSSAQQALHDFAKLKSPKSSGGEGYNIVAVNMSFNTPQLFYEGAAQNSTVTKLSDGTYQANEVISKIKNNGSGDAKYWKVATDNDIILVNSAGNKGYDHAGDPGIWATEVNSNGDLVLGGKMVIVGNWYQNGIGGNKAGHVCLDINTENNTCNDQHRISDFYILAPGTNIMGAVPDDQYMQGSGTSFSAPHVTGAFGVLNQMWPYMRGENLVKLVMNTADKNLPNYDKNIHGQGLLDLDEATKPQGAIGIVTTGRVDHPKISLNNTYFSTGTALPSALDNLQLMVLDDYNRNYYLNIGSTFQVQDKRKFSDISQVMNGYNYMPHTQMYGSFAQGGQYDLDKFNFGFYSGENGKGDYSINVGKNFLLSNNFKFKSSIGLLNEENTWLGNNSSGVLAVGNNNQTNFGLVGIDYLINKSILSFDYSKGYSKINTKTESLIKEFSNIESESYKLSLKSIKNDYETFGFSYSIPNYISKGFMNLEVAESVNLDGSINYANLNSDIKQTTKEKNFGFFYSLTPKKITDINLNFNLEFRENVSGIDEKSGGNANLGFNKKFLGSCKFLWMKNPKCFDVNGSLKEEILNIINVKKQSQHEKHGLVYDEISDKFQLTN